MLSSSDDLTILIKSLGIDTWDDLKSHIQNLPYGRNANRADLSLVLKEAKGTCSSKHAFLKHISSLNQIPNIELILCLYNMNQTNTPGIGNVLQEHDLPYIPEAHCYLRDNGIYLDLTNSSSDLDRIKDNIIEELEIEPHEVSTFKINYHKDYVMQWIVKEKIPFSFERIWSIREECISKLSN